MHKQALAINTQAGATMTSLEIATVTGKRHADVMRDVRTMLEQLDMPKLNFEGTYLSEQNKELPCFKLDLERILVLVGQYPASVKAPIMDAVAKNISQHKELISAIRAFDLTEVPASMYLYVAKNTSTGSLKVGISANPEKRVKALQVGCDGILELVATVSAENGFQSESDAHKRLSGHRIHGEWFSASADYVLEVLQ